MVERSVTRSVGDAKQLSFSDAEYGGKRKQTRREVFLAEMQRAVPWRQLEGLIEPHYPKNAFTAFSNGTG